MRRVGAIALLVSLVAVVSPVRAATLEDMFAAINAGDMRAARAVASDIREPGSPDFPAFVDATAFLASGDCGRARAIAEKVVTERPDFLPAYDVVAECMSRTGEGARAARMFRGIAQRLPEGQDRDALLARAASLAPGKPVSLTVSGSARPTTNLNRGTDETSIGPFAIDPGSRRLSGVSVDGDLRAERVFILSPRLMATAAASVGAEYDSLSRQVMPTVRVDASLRRLISPETSIGASVYLEGKSRFDGKGEIKPGIVLDIQHRLSPVMQVSARIDAGLIERFGPDPRNGLNLKAAASLIHDITPKDRMTWSAEVTFDKRSSPNQSGLGAALNAEFEHRFDNGFITSLGVGGAARFHDSLAPLSASKQADYSVTGSVGFSHAAFMIGNIRPEIGYRFTKQWSNDVFSRYEAHDVMINAKAAF